ncbi:MAG: hypothetical protein DMD96_23420 [Candidatus Rokuibacteriota bacterium]|nr:MAG: hypothetical protein DMD96_23420 [Candidatus Rokubacteria bacterium]
MDSATETLLRDLEASPTDLRKLVVSALWRDRSSITIESEAVARWERDDPHRWASVQAWLLSRGVTIMVLRPRSSTVTSPPARTSQGPEPPPAGMRG